MATKKQIEDFLKGKRIALIGMSRDKRGYSRMLYNEYTKAGYDIVPVNPNADELEGKKVFKTIKDVSPKIDRAFIILPPDKTEQAMLECTAAGVQNVWMHSHIAGGVQNTRAIFQAENNKINLITGYCPMMYMNESMMFHKIHGFIVKLIGGAPK